MALVMAAQAALVYQVQYMTSVSHAAGIAGAVMLFIFEGAFTIGFQATVWVYPCEILPLRLRQKGSSISTASNWICNYIIVQITPPAIQNIGWKTYIIFAVLNVGAHLSYHPHDTQSLITERRRHGFRSSMSFSPKAKVVNLRTLIVYLLGKKTLQSWRGMPKSAAVKMRHLRKSNDLSMPSLCISDST